MNIRNLVILFVSALPIMGANAQSDYTAVEFIDAFLASNTGGIDAVKASFVDLGDRVWLSSPNEEGNVKNLSVAEFADEVSSVQESFTQSFNTVVSLHRRVGPLSTIFCSVHGQLVDKDTEDTVYTRAIHSYKLIQGQEGWKILQLNIQNEQEAFNSDLWPDQITNQFPLKSRKKVIVYNGDKLFNVESVDLAPQYPFQDEFNALLSEFKVQIGQVENLGPFTVIINEDGTAALGYVGDLSGEQIEQAKEFVSGMSPWYPAVYEKSSVKCKLIFSIE